MSLFSERHTEKPITNREKDLAFFKQLVFVKEYDYRTHKSWIYRITQNNSLPTVARLGWHTFQVGQIFTEAKLRVLLKRYNLDLNDLNISNLH